MKALILAGGRGSRLGDWTENRNKSMIKLFEKPLIEYNLDQAINAGVNEIIITVCYKKEEIIKYFGKEYRGIKITYVDEGFKEEELNKKGIVDAIETAKDAIGKSDFILMLADEIVINAKMNEIVKKFKEESLCVVCGIVFDEDRESISKTYTAMIDEKSRVFRLIEKPKIKINNIKGTGHCVIKNEMIDYLKKTPINAYRNQREMVDWIQVAIDNGKKVKIYPIAKEYANINTQDVFDKAKEMLVKNNPRVLIIHNQMKYYGGAELLIVELANWLTRKGIKNEILTLSSSKKVEKELINTEIIIPKNKLIVEPPGYKNIQDILEAIKIFRKELRKIEKNYDVINFHDFPVTWSLWPRKKSSVWFMNMPPNLWSKPNAGFFLKGLNKLRILFDRFIVNRSVDIIAVSSVLNQLRANQRYDVGVKIVNFGVDYDFFSKGNSKKAFDEFKELKGKFIIMQSGQICESKNQIESIKAIEKIKNKIPNVLLVLTGKEDIEYKKKLDEYIQEKKLEKYVKYILFSEEKEKLRNLYKTADIGVFPISGQGSVLAPCEMLCSGVPVIISEDMETTKLFKENNLGIITKEYSKAILEMYNHKEKYKKQAKEAGIFIKKNLSWESFADNMIEEFKRVWKN